MYVPPMVCYTYTKSISGTIFNYKEAVRELDFNIGKVNMTCSCGNSSYMYAPAGHVVTGNLKNITDYARKLLMKGPSYREQNNINLKLKNVQGLYRVYPDPSQPEACKGTHHTKMTIML